MTEKNDGGPAFPTAEWAGGNGMSLRDWFAGQAIGTMMLMIRDSAESGVVYADGGFSLAASTAYDVADAMLKAREA